MVSLLVVDGATTWWYGGPPAPVNPTPSTLPRDFPDSVSVIDDVPSGVEVGLRVKVALL